MGNIHVINRAVFDSLPVEDQRIILAATAGISTANSSNFEINQAVFDSLSFLARANIAAAEQQAPQQTNSTTAQQTNSTTTDQTKVYDQPPKVPDQIVEEKVFVDEPVQQNRDQSYMPPPPPPPPMESRTRNWTMIIFLIVFGIFWILPGLAGLITSFVCLKNNGSIGAKVGGVFLALLLGPFYWVYFGVMRSEKQYCFADVKKVVANVNTVTTVAATLPVPAVAATLPVSAVAATLPVTTVPATLPVPAVPATLPLQK